MRNTADEWRHPHFVRGQPKLLENIVRKAHDVAAAPSPSEGSDGPSHESDKAHVEFGADASPNSSKRPASAIVESKSVPVLVKADPVVPPAPVVGHRPRPQVADRDAYLDSGPVDAYLNSGPASGYTAMSGPASSLHHATESSYTHAGLEPRRVVGRPYGMYSREEEIMLQRRLAAVSSSARLPPPPPYNHYAVPPSYATSRGTEPPETLNYLQHHKQTSQSYSLGNEGIVRQLRRLNEIRDDLLRKMGGGSQAVMMGSHPGGARFDQPSGQVGLGVEVPTVLHPPHSRTDAFRETELFRSTSGPAKKRFKASPSMLLDFSGLRPPHYAFVPPRSGKLEVPWPRSQHGMGMDKFERHVPRPTSQHGMGMDKFERHIPLPPAVNAVMLPQQSKSNKSPKSSTEELECAAILSGLSGQEKSESMEHTKFVRHIS